MRAINANANLSHMHKEVMSKCSFLWNASSRPKSAEIVEKILGHTLSWPGETMWNSLYDALRQILNSKSRIMELLQHLGLKETFENHDFKYIEEHLKCTQPIAEAVDILQGEKYAFYGLLLPTLLTIRKKLQRLASHDWLYCKAINDALIVSVETRFKEFYFFSSKEAQNAAIASLSHPHFKNSWLVLLEDDSKKKILIKFEKLLAESMAKRQQPSTYSQKENMVACCYNSFFNFDAVDCTTEDWNTQCGIQKLNFFHDPSTDCIMLNMYPELKNIFLEYNTPLPSPASVERLFSYATMTNSAKCNKLSDGNFEKRVVLKANTLDEENIIL